VWPKGTAVLATASAVALLVGASEVRAARNASPGRPYVLHVPALASDGVPDAVFTITGRVLAGPTCPVERIPPDPGCAPRPVSGAAVLFTNSSGQEVGRALSDANGDFSLMLPRGTYSMVPQPVPGLLRTRAPSVVVVDAPVELTVLYDTGIR
jgi:hypothetical protein